MSLYIGTYTSADVRDGIFRIVQDGGVLFKPELYSVVRNQQILNKNNIRFYWSGGLGFKLANDTIYEINKLYNAFDTSGDLDISIVADNPTLYVDYTKYVSYFRCADSLINLFRNSEPASIPIEAGAVVNNVTFDSAINWRFGVASKANYIDNTVLRQYFNTSSLVASTTYAFSFLVKPLDVDHVPSFGTGVNDIGSFVIGGVPITSENYTVVALHNNIFFVSGSGTTGVSDLTLNGVQKATTNNNIGFEMSACMIAPLQRKLTLADYIKTTGSEVTRPKSKMTLTNVVPQQGTILLWVKHLLTDTPNKLLEWTGGYLSYDSNAISVQIGNGTVRSSNELKFQTNQAEKLWFYAISYDNTNVTVYRGDKEGNFEVIIPTIAHGGTPSIQSLIVNNADSVSLQLNSDILTTDDILSTETIQTIYTSNQSLLQNRGYGIDQVDRLELKSKNEIRATFAPEAKTASKTFLFKNIYASYNNTSQQYFATVFQEDGYIYDRDELNADIISFLNKNNTNGIMPSFWWNGRVNIPSKQYNIVDINSEQYGGDIFFVRTSPKVYIDKYETIRTVGNEIIASEYKDGTYLGHQAQPTATNLMLHSNDFTNAYWNSDGVLVQKQKHPIYGNICIVDELNSNGYHEIARTDGNIFDGKRRSIELWIKNVKDTRYVYITTAPSGALLGGADQRMWAVIDIQNGEITQTSANISKSTIQPYLDGYRVYIYTNTDSASNANATRFRFGFLNGDDPIAMQYTGNGKQCMIAYGGAYLNKLQIDSPIVTTNVTETRASDIFSVTDAENILGQNEGTVYVKFNAQQPTALFIEGWDYPINSVGFYRLAMAYSPLQLRISLNGTLIQTINGTFDFSDLSFINVGHYFGSIFCDEYITEYALYKQQLSNTQLNILTS
jgi:hypothetical protein